MKHHYTLILSRISHAPRTFVYRLAHVGCVWSMSAIALENLMVFHSQGQRDCTVVNSVALLSSCSLHACIYMALRGLFERIRQIEMMSAMSER